MLRRLFIDLLPLNLTKVHSAFSHKNVIALTAALDALERPLDPEETVQLCTTAAKMPSAIQHAFLAHPKVDTVTVARIVITNPSQFGSGAADLRAVLASPTFEPAVQQATQEVQQRPGVYLSPKRSFATEIFLGHSGSGCSLRCTKK